MGQNISLGRSTPWLSRGEGGEMNEMLFIRLVTAIPPGATGKKRFRNITLKGKNYKVFMFLVGPGVA
jgi:hypothetical protein